MNECKGIFGWMFGHRFEPMHNSIPPDLNGFKLNGSTAKEGIAILQALTRKEAVGVWCSRCGAQQVGIFAKGQP